MPIYEYSCSACGEDTERLQKLSEPDLVECPHCGKPALRRRVSAAGFRLAGSGWYETDFKKDGKRNLSGDSQTSGSDDKASSGSDADKKSNGKSDQKPADKSAEKSGSGQSDKPGKRASSDKKGGKNRV